MNYIQATDSPLTLKFLTGSPRLGGMTKKADRAQTELFEALAELIGWIRGLQIKPTMQTWMGVDLSMSQLKAMFVVLWTGGLTSRALADKLGVGPSAVTPLVDALVGHELVRREPDAEDRRVTWLRPTPSAEALRGKLLFAHDGVLRTLAEGIEPSQATEIARAVRVLAEAAKARATGPFTVVRQASAPEM